MKRRMRKEVTIIRFDGITQEGGFIFEAYNQASFWETINLNLTTYEKGATEFAVDYQVEVPKVAEIIAGLFSKESNFANVDTITLRYRNICLTFPKNTGRKNIISRIRKEMADSEYQKGNNEIVVDTEIGKKQDKPYDYDKVYGFKKISEWGKELLFRSRWEDSKTFTISSLKEGVIKIEAITGNEITTFVSNLKDIFTPYSNFYGIKAVEVEFNAFSIKADETNIDRILYLFYKSLDISHNLYKQEWEEYRLSPEYTRKRAKELKKEHRKKVVVEKVRNSQKKGTDFTYADKDRQKKWEKCKEINSNGEYGQCILDYTILWAQYMEYLMTKHNQKVVDIWDRCSHLADIYGVTGYMYGCATNILSSVWKYGEVVRKEHNKRYNYEGDGVVNPAVLTISA